MNQITFNRTGHTILNNGIIGLNRYLKEAKENPNKPKVFTDFTFDFNLSDMQLEINSEQLPQLLEELYYWMGQEVYDTYTLKQQQNAEKLRDCNVYYDEQQDQFKAFPRIYTCGLPHLLTNNAQGVTRNEESSSNIKKLKESNPERLELIEDFFNANNLKLGKKVYFNEPYTKITRLTPLKENHLKPGPKRCFLTGETFKELVDITNISPFFSGIENFSSRLSAGDKKISWKARYLSMFSAVTAFYHYPDTRRKTLGVFLFEADSLRNLNDVLNMADLRKSSAVLRSEEFTSNIEMAEGFKKDGFTEQYEVGLGLIYSFYKKVLKKYGGLEEGEVAGDSMFAETFSKLNFAIDSFKAEKFASTMRPNSYENINRLNFIIKFFHEFEKIGGHFNKVFWSWRLIKPKDRSARDSYRLERVLRNEISKEFLRGKSILTPFEELLFTTYNLLCAGEYVGYKDYKQLVLFFQLYESKTKTMDETIQQTAITLGKQIGIKMRQHDKSLSGADNAKKGRGDLITLRKARTQKQFLDELIRIDFKYGLTVNEALITKITEQNYYAVKQFLIIGALNILNPAIHPYNKSEKPAES